ncbi:MAG: phage holin family protein [Actinomycetaceae bacterium]|nr:phage holin family protein [Arcanobacterium sp.]MDD7687126.1 phage holin family protein [Actinomycetaceae bacterium]MDY5273209.1 phage holin family protein [Arcanobacterium sp.]
MNTDKESSIPVDSPSTGTTIGELVAKVTAQFSALVRDEISIAKLNAKAKVTKLGIGGVLLAVAAVLSLYVVGILLVAASFGVSAALGNRPWLGFLIIGGALLLVTLIVALLGVAKLKASQAHTVNPAAGLAKDVEAVKKGIQSE